MLEKGFQDLLSELHRDKGEGEFLTPGKSALRNAKSKAVAAPPGLAPQADLPGLDAGAVAAAMQAGIPMDQLREFFNQSTCFFQKKVQFWYSFGAVFKLVSLVI